MTYTLVKIIKCNNPSYWYNNRIGEIYGVSQDVISDLYRVVYGADNDMGEFYISKGDMIDISEERNNKLQELGI